MKKRKELPDLSQQSVGFVDGTPDREYPLRILRAYRENCNCKWVTRGKPDPLLDAMNDTQVERAKLLDEAIRVLEEHNVGV